MTAPAPTNAAPVRLATPPVVRVEMPERGIFLVRVPMALADHVSAGGAAMVTLDYGLDTCRVLDAGPYDPTVHGPRLPGFQIVRLREPGDEVRIRENAVLAEKMCATFLRLAAGSTPGLRVPYSRLSFGRDRLFIKFVATAPRTDLRRFGMELRHSFGVQVEVWQMGLRDEAAAVGGFGVCGRVACCVAWQRRFPSGLTADLAREQGLAMNPGLLNGICGRFKCCLAYEAGCPCRRKGNDNHENPGAERPEPRAPRNA